MNSLALMEVFDPDEDHLVEFIKGDNSIEDEEEESRKTEWKAPTAAVLSVPKPATPPVAKSPSSHAVVRPGDAKETDESFERYKFLPSFAQNSFVAHQEQNRTEDASERDDIEADLPENMTTVRSDVSWISWASEKELLVNV